MRQGNFRALALGCVAIFALARPAWADKLATSALTPMQAASFDIGVKHVVGYFLDGGDHCQLILAIADVGDDEASSVSHVEFMVASGAVARLQSNPGGSLSFTCDNRAHAMRVTKNDGLARRSRAD
ncbi:MAG: hypothetical protein ACR650_13520 [Methylocystis sp.]|jgi:hypothetical protein